MLLAIDIGNTNVVCGLFEGRHLHQQWRLATERQRTPDDYWATLQTLAVVAGLNLPELVQAVIIGSVVPPLTAVFAHIGHDHLGCQPLRVHAGLDLGMPIRVREPERVGADRLLNAIAARALYGVPCISLDFGTATKFDVVDASGAFIGGAIAPGLMTAADALVQGTALLPRIDYEAPPSPVGDDTTSAMQAGIVLGYVGLVEGLLVRIRALFGGLTVPVVATGGLAPLIIPLIPGIDYHDPTLTLQGLRLVYERVLPSTVD